MAPTDYRFDGRDMAVIESLEPGERYTVSEIQHRFRRHTDVRRERTLYRRGKDLLSQPEFERLNGPYWLFTGLEE